MFEQFYKEKSLPSTVEEMTFNDYVEVIGNGKNWPNFSKVFRGKHDLQRKITRTKLVRIRDLRNDTFHFKRDLNDSDTETLITHRNWLLQLSRILEAKQHKSDDKQKNES